MMNRRLQEFISDPRLIPDRCARGVKYVVIGYSDDGSSITELTADSEEHARLFARTWATMFSGTAACFCVQNGEIGGRPFDSFSTK
jgi:hypothetical protein